MSNKKIHFSEIPVGEKFRNKYGVFRRLLDTRKGAGRAEIVAHVSGLSAGVVVVMHRNALVEAA